MSSANQYLGDSRGHKIKSLEDEGSVLMLEDESRWQIYEGFITKTKHWLVNEMITVIENKDKIYPYRLINVHKNESVEVRLL